jgi:hypothetical protein
VVRAAVTGRRVAMARQDDLHFHFVGASDGSIEIVNFKPQEYTVAIGLVCRITDPPVVVLDLEAVQLEDERAVED